MVRENVADSTLRVVQEGNQTCFCVPFDDLSENPPWDDFLLYRFLCTACGRMFSLSCDTYHGNGKWERI